MANVFHGVIKSLLDFAIRSLVTRGDGDLRSTEVHLHANNIFDQSLESLFRTKPVMK